MTAVTAAEAVGEERSISPSDRLEATLLLAWSRTIADHRQRYDDWLESVAKDRAHALHFCVRAVR